MNKIYKVIWNSARGCYVVVHEFAKCNGKKAQAVVLAGLVAASLGMAGTAHAEEYGQKIDGDGNVSGATKTVTTDVSESVYGGWVTGNGDAINNTVTIKGCTVDGWVDGGRVDGNGAEQGASSNKVYIENATVKEAVRGGYVDDDGNASYNEVYIKTTDAGSKTSTDDVYGGYVFGDGDAAYNTVEITGQLTEGGSTTTIEGRVNGGYVLESGETHHNTVKIKNSVVNGPVYGGYNEAFGDEECNSYNNTVEIIGSSTGSVKGGYIDDPGDVHDNKVTINGEGNANAEIHGSVYGGQAEGKGEHKGKVDHNDVIIKNVKNIKVDGHGYIVGGKGAASADHNTVTIENVDAIQFDGGDIHGGETQAVGETSVQHNTVSIKNVKSISVDINGGVSEGFGTIDYNTVEIDNSTVEDEVIGGYIYDSDSVDDGDGTASHNTVTITNNSTIKKSVYGGKIDEDGTGVNGNTVTISDSTVDKDVYGGYEKWKGIAGEKDNGNKVTLTNATVGGSVYGGYVEGTGNADWNEVTVTGTSTVTDNVWGGCAVDGNAQGNTVKISDGNLTTDRIEGGLSAKVSTGNTVEIINSTVDANDIYGALGGEKANGNTVKIINSTADVAIIIGGLGGNDGTATGNTVDLEGKLTFNKDNTRIYGGFASNPVKTGNTLNLTNTKIEVANIGGFENINYDVENLKKNDKIIALTTSANTDIDGTKVTFKGTLDPTSEIGKGDKIYLIHKAGGKLEGEVAADSTKSGTIKEGTSIEHDYTIEKEDDKHLVLTLGESREIEEEKPEEPDKPGTRLTEDSKIYVESRLAEVGLINSNVDQFVQSTLPQAVMLSGQEAGYVPFASIIGGKTKLETGSHVDLKHRSVNVGFAKTIQKEGGSKLTYGPFFEYGKGDFDSYLDNGTKGDGDVTTTGGGLFLRNEGSKGLYVEGSLRAGRVKSDTKTSLGTAYDTSSTYYGAHVGLGKVNDVGNGNTLDTYARYLYSHTGGDDVTLSDGEQYKFDSVDSNRLQLGARYSFANGLYVGAAWQYEASGTANATYVKYNLDSAAPSIHGHSGVYELGWKHADATNWDFDVAVTGYSGKERGATFRLGAAYHF